eukprot:TRINITY_DN40764_c0_g1_i1.p1 TRINITY_DN40764_c0_g1~~TRINITY_DN40764_c0_g1_i1.p1  ORF type:complete len:829 (+),score=125.79 TRINITY_DN40764_c0_g1_i1:72-2558(+)
MEMEAPRSVVSSAPPSPHGSSEQTGSGLISYRVTPSHGIVVNGTAAGVSSYPASSAPSVMVSRPIVSASTGSMATASSVLPAMQKLHVSIIQATGLKHMNVLGDSPWCVCEVKHADKRTTPTKCETRAVHKTLEPVWNEEHELEPWHVGEPLEFTVYDQGLMGSRLEGKVLVQSDLFYPNGFEGDLAFPGNATLRVRIVPAALQAAHLEAAALAAAAASSNGGGGTGETVSPRNLSVMQTSPRGGFSSATDPTTATGSPTSPVPAVGLATARNVQAGMQRSDSGRHLGLQVSSTVLPHEARHRGFSPGSGRVASPRMASNLVGLASSRFAASLPPRLRAIYSSSNPANLTTTTNNSSVQGTAPGTPSGSLHIARGLEPAEAGETIDGLRSEIGDLRSELDALRGMLNDGLHQKSVATQRAEKLQVEAQRLRSELAAQKLPSSLNQNAQQVHRSGCETARRHGQVGSEGTPVKMTRSRFGSVTDLRAGASSPRGRNLGTAGSVGSVSRGRSASQRADVDGHPQSPQSRTAPLPPPSAGRADEIDMLWCSVLQHFPQHPDWILVKEKAGVYRMGNPSGKKILCRVSHGGLQVRVGGGWMSAVPFMERHGPQGMASKAGDETPTNGGGGSFSTASFEQGLAMMDTPPSIERLLVPTKCWASKIGINTTPDLREHRRHTPEEVAASKRSPTPNPREHLGSPTTGTTSLVTAAAPSSRTASLATLTGSGRVTVAPRGVAGVGGGHLGGPASAAACATTATVAAMAASQRPPPSSPLTTGRTQFATGQVSTPSKGQLGKLVPAPWPGHIAQGVSPMPIAQPPPRVHPGHMSITR